jgi:hypothetical protein
VLQAGGLVALVGVRIDVDDGLLRRHMAGGAHRLLEVAPLVAEVVAAIDLRDRVDDRAVGGEVRPGADRDVHRAHARVLVAPRPAVCPPPAQLVDPQDVDVRVDRVRVAARVLGDVARAVGRVVDAEVREVRLEAAVLGQPDERGVAPGGRRGREVRVRLADRQGNAIDEERVFCPPRWSTSVFASSRVLCPCAVRYASVHPPRK